MLKNKMCFVISPIGKEKTPERQHANDVITKLIEPALKATDYELLRADAITKMGNITTDIVSHLANDELVIAVLTDHNPNVYYELAIRHATRKPVITLIREGEDIPFDVKDYRTVFYDFDNNYNLSNCIENIKNQIANIEAGAKIINPISEALDVEELKRRNDPLEQRFAQVNASVKDLTQQIKKLKARTPYKDLIDKYRDEIDMLQTFREAGIISVHRSRVKALKKFVKAIWEEKNEIIVIGSSLLGLLQRYEYAETKNALEAKVKEVGAPESSLQVKFLLTHPAVADLRADQEARKYEDIGNEIIKSLEKMKEWKVSSDNVRLYMGTPTIFAIKTTNLMLLNPYAYGAVAFNSPCLIVKNDPEEHFYFYNEYDKAHFSAWDSDAAIRITDFDTTITELKSSLDMYKDNIKVISDSVHKNNHP